MAQIRKLPIGIQSFEVLRTGGCLYVDKTALIHQLASTEIPYFLSRPRRFGKSLLVSAFKAYFEGRKELFEGLAIEQLEEKWEKYPVLHLDLNAKDYNNVEALHAILNRHLDEWEKRYVGKEQTDAPEDRFFNVIKRACEQTGKRVVVLVDEYDKPLLANLLNDKLSDQLRRALKAFYGVLKSAGDYLRFVFITGVTKFAQVTVFSDLNQLSDISMEEQYTTLCGITKEELLQVFQPEIAALAKKQKLSFDAAVAEMTQRYDGYHFAPDTPGMFNPFSVLNALGYGNLKDYWFQTGTPTFLADLLTNSDYDLRLLVDGTQMAASDFAEYRAQKDNPIPLIYQSGYLTIQGYDREFRLYTLGFPNDEVRYGFMNFLAPYYTQVRRGETPAYIAGFAKALRAGDVDSFLHHMKVFFAGMSYELSDDTERHYQAIFYVILTLMCEFVQTEVRSAHGRADAVVKTDKYIYLFEFKLNDTAEAALQQIDEREYLLPYTLDGRQLIKVGVSFDKEKRNIGRYLIEPRNKTSVSLGTKPLSASEQNFC
ncbi:MAG: ATP-binding protein [Prevotellaceae bacterium]|nr:ATP-binding protein [Prevotellaceae bacterium]